MSASDTVASFSLIAHDLEPASVPTERDLPVNRDRPFGFALEVKLGDEIAIFLNELAEVADTAKEIAWLQHAHHQDVMPTGTKWGAGHVLLSFGKSEHGMLGHGLNKNPNETIRSSPKLVSAVLGTPLSSISTFSTHSAGISEVRALFAHTFYNSKTSIILHTHLI